MPSSAAASRHRPAAPPPAAGKPAAPTWALAFALGFALAFALILAGCSTAPVRDGLPPRLPPDLDRVPNAVPRIEAVRPGGPNKPYTVNGRQYVPLSGDVSYREVGGASWYGSAFHGKPTSSGEPYDMFAMTAAHRTLPIPSYVRVRNPANGREVTLRVNDRGPFVEGRIIDLSIAAAHKLGVLGAVAPVEVRRITFAEIRAAQSMALKRAPDLTQVLAVPLKNEGTEGNEGVALAAPRP